MSYWLRGVEGGDAFIAGDRLVAERPPGARLIDCRGGRLAPGRICAHTHLYSGLAPFGLPAPEPKPTNFLQILERLWWRLDRALDAASLAAGARYALAEALLDGTTTLIDHHESPALIPGVLDGLAEAFTALGARGVLCYGATERNGGAAEGQAGLAESLRVLDAPLPPTLRGLVGLHASFTASDDLIRAAGAAARARGVGVHVHVAEDGADVADAQARGYPGPLERLLALGALPQGSLVVHGVHLSSAQVAAAAAAGAWLVQCPRSNAGNQVGYPAGLAAAEGRVALGTDGYPAQMSAELAALAAHGEGPERARRRLDTGRALVGQVFQADFGGLHPGAMADLVVRAPDGRARHVWVAGRLVVEDCTLLTADLAALRATAQREAQALWSRMATLPPSLCESHP